MLHVDERRDGHGMTALHRAARDDVLATVERLLTAGADANATTYSGDTPLHVHLFYSVAPQSLSIVRKLCEYGLDINTKNNAGLEAIFYVRDLLVAEFLVFKGANVNTRDTQNNQTALHWLAQEDSLEVFEFFCALVDDLDVVDDYGNTALSAAVDWEQRATTQLLLKLNVDTTVAIRHSRNVSRNEIRHLLLVHLQKSALEREQSRIETLQRILTRLSIRLMRYAQGDIVGICLAMYSLELPPYVFLWIMDWVPRYDMLSHHKKIQLIYAVRNSIWKLKGNGKNIIHL